MNYKIITNNNVSYVTFPMFEKHKEIFQGITTRIGGVSTGCYSSLNLGFNTGDERENILSNFKLLSQAIDIDINDFVTTAQTHTNNIRIVTADDRGKGVIREKDYTDVDGLITDVPQIALVTKHADCTPIVFYDANKKVIGAAHAGWKGTLYKIAEEMIKKFVSNYNSNPEDIIVGIGPSLCQDCFEVDEDVKDMFISVDDKYHEYTIQKGEKYYINLWKINKYLLLKNGIKSDNISCMELCTKENTDLFFSHRGQHGKRGLMASIIELR